MLLKTVVPALAILGLLWLAGESARPARDLHLFTTPAFAQMQTHEEPADTTVRRMQGTSGDTLGTGPLLRVEVETSYGWFWQKSTGRAYVVAGRNSSTRVKVGRLCMRLVAHDSTERCLSNADSLLILEHKRGVGIPKRTAYLTAWGEDPKLDTIRVQLAP